MKVCKIDECDKKMMAKGMCQMHYLRVKNGIDDMRPGRLPKGGWKWKEDDPRYVNANRNKICSIPDCTCIVYANDLCRVHYELNRRNGYPSKKIRPKMKCKVDGCPKNAIGKSGLCRLHSARIKNGTDLTKPKGNSGDLNYMWRGGVSEYPNHYILKKNRIIVLNSANWVCEYCGGRADRVHHRDHSKDNHALNNLAPSCAKCNAKQMRHNPKPRTSKFIRLYGLSLREMSDKLDIPIHTVKKMHDDGILKRELNKELINAILF